MSINVTPRGDVPDHTAQIVLPGTDVAMLNQACVPQAISQLGLRRRPIGARRNLLK